MSGRRSRNKGAQEERNVVNLHRDNNVPATRTLERGKRSDGSDTWDIDLHIRGEQHPPLIGECKLRGDGFKQLYAWLGDNDFLTVRADRKERLYVLPERVWLRLMSLIDR